jgi:hypothetical protein
MKTGATLEQAQAAKREALRVFGQIVGEVAVGVMPLGGGRYGLKVNLASKPDTKLVLPAEVEGVPVQVDVVGKIRKRQRR